MTAATNTMSEAMAMMMMTKHESATLAADHIPSWSQEHVTYKRGEPRLQVSPPYPPLPWLEPEWAFWRIEVPSLKLMEGSWPDDSCYTEEQGERS
jgi:hypothetical protein